MTAERGTVFVALSLEDLGNIVYLLFIINFSFLLPPLLKDTNCERA